MGSTSHGSFIALLLFELVHVNKTQDWNDSLPNQFRAIYRKLYSEFCSQIISDRQEAFLAGDLGSVGLFSVKEIMSHHQQAGSRRESLCSFNLGLCLSSCSDLSWCDWVSGEREKAAALEGKPRDPSGRVSSLRTETERTMGIPRFHYPKNPCDSSDGSGVPQAAVYCMACWETRRFGVPSSQEKISVFNLTRSPSLLKGQTPQWTSRQTLIWRLCRLSFGLSDSGLLKSI